MGLDANSIASQTLSAGNSPMLRLLLAGALSLPLALLFSVQSIVIAAEAVVASPSTTSSDRGQVDYVTEVKPVLVSRCAGCHGRVQQKSGFRTDAAKLLHQGGDGGPSIVPGNRAESPLYQAITVGIYDEKMPPEGKPLSPEQIELIGRWIDEGANYPADETIPPGPETHWLFTPPQKQALSASPVVSEVENPIDRYFQDQWQAAGITPARVAAPEIRLRRLYVDLVGVPPSRSELQDFSVNPTTEAWEATVDRLLADPRYAERWTRHWMDVWRYCDEMIFGANEIMVAQTQMWRWRDWLIESLIADKPYDQMVREMLAADEMYPGDIQAARATGFLVRSWTVLGGKDLWTQEVVEHVGKSFIGLTFQCARCHDHKYDPVTQTNFYEMRAFFEPMQARTDRVQGQRDTFKDGIPRIYDGELGKQTFLYKAGNPQAAVKDKPLSPAVPSLLANASFQFAEVKLPRAVWQPGSQDFIQQEDRVGLTEAVEKTRKDLEAAEKTVNQLAEADAPAEATSPINGWTLPGERPTEAERRLRRCQQALIKAEAELDAFIKGVAADNAGAMGQPDHQELSHTAQKAQRQKKYEAAALDHLQSEHVLLVASESARADVALEASNVMVNREKLDAARAELSKEPGTHEPVHAGYPATSSGRRTALAKWITSTSNPGFARTLVNHVWSRQMGRPFVKSMFDFGLNGPQPEHQRLLDWLSVDFADRGYSLKSLHRLIATSQVYQLDSTRRTDLPGQSIDPDNKLYWRANTKRMDAETVRDSLLTLSKRLDSTIGGRSLSPSDAGYQNRRGLYLRQSLDGKETMLSVFDGADVNECYRRHCSIVPQQSLALANSKFSFEQARGILAVTDPAGSLSDHDFIVAAFETVLSRKPVSEEQSECSQFMARQLELLSRQYADNEWIGVPGDQGKPAELPPATAVRASLIHVLINHNDFIVVR